MTKKSHALEDKYKADEEIKRAAEHEAEQAPTKTNLEKLPNPTGWRLLVMPFKVKEETGYVLKMGPLCYDDKDKYPTGAWCKEKDWVMFARYAGSRIDIDGGEIKMLNDDEILGTIDDPKDILHAM